MSKQVLIVDDEWTIQQVLQARLSAHGYEVEMASDGPAGLAAARANTPDVILLDLRMPDMDGFEVLRRLRADESTCEVPVIFLTANIQDTVREQAKAAGAAGFLTKPYEARTVLDAIGTATAVAA